MIQAESTRLMQVVMSSNFPHFRALIGVLVDDGLVVNISAEMLYTDARPGLLAGRVIVIPVDTVVVVLAQVMAVTLAGMRQGAMTAVVQGIGIGVLTCLDANVLSVTITALVLITMPASSEASSLLC